MDNLTIRDPFHDMEVKHPKAAALTVAGEALHFMLTDETASEAFAQVLQCVSGDALKDVTDFVAELATLQGESTSEDGPWEPGILDAIHKEIRRRSFPDA